MEFREDVEGIWGVFKREFFVDFEEILVEF